MQGSNPDALDTPLAEESRKHLSRALKQMYMGDSVWEPDVTLDLGVARIPAHRVILAAGSPVLKAMFQSAMADSTSASVEIKEVDAGDMEIILKYLNGKLGKIPEDRLSSLLLATDRFEVTALMERCATMLQRGLAVESVIQVAVLADRINHSKLYKSCVAFASLEENRSLVGKHPEMMRVNAEDPRFSLKFMAAMLDETVDEGKRGQKRIRS